MQAHTDRKLVDRLIKGDTRAFDAFFASYFPRLYLSVPIIHAAFGK